MLNDIRLHIDDDDEIQSQNERKLARHIHSIENKNIEALRLHVPSLSKHMANLPNHYLSVFIDKFENINLVNVASGNTVYPLRVDEVIRCQYQNFALHSAILNLDAHGKIVKQANIPIVESTEDYKQNIHYADCLLEDCRTSHPDTLVIFGLGKGLHINALLKQFTIKNLVIYEDNWEVFRISLMIFDWTSLLDSLLQANIKLFLQFGTQNTTLYEDIDELFEHTQAKRILFFEHCKSDLSKHALSQLRAQKWHKGIGVDGLLKAPDANTHRLNNVSAIEYKKWQNCSTEHTLFKSNIELFSQDFPEIADVFLDYKSKVWQVIEQVDTGEINLFNTIEHSFFTSEKPKFYANQSAQGFMHKPNLDGLVFGYSGDKLRHYTHNAFIRQADNILSGLGDQSGELPENIKVLLVFGLGQAYMLEQIFQNRNLEHLIICEPNPDFFYASLFAIDWQPIFDHVRKHDKKLYINIGESSSRLFKDLMSQFLALGPYLLNQTYLMQSYHNPMLEQVLSEVRTQLQVIFSMGENFDHVLYGISHTTQSLQSGAKMLRVNSSTLLSKRQKQLPVFVVGNGPSLDTNIEILKEYSERAIIISCGTALQALHRFGITPDFHGEVEQNRANYDWVSRIQDYDYLKQISLLSVNGMHPDSIQLYKDVFLSFKTGESSTTSALSMFSEPVFHRLEHAYPTVSNMVLSTVLSLGFDQIYLIGVDLGFADQNKHHSSSSGYYENGQQIYDYKNTHNADLRVKGNKQEFVFTKTEFNISRMLIEQVLSEYKAECFNLSNGVFIEGTLPLDSEDVLIIANEQDKQHSLSAMKNCFCAFDGDITSMYSRAYNDDLMQKQMLELQDLTRTLFDENDDIDAFIEKCSHLIIDAKRKGGSLFFYYYFNSVNYLSAAIAKANMHDDKVEAVHACNQILNAWSTFLYDSQYLLCNKFSVLDCSEAFGDRRERYLLQNAESVYYFVDDDDKFLRLQAYFEEHYSQAMNCSNDLMQLIQTLQTNRCVVDIGSKQALNNLADLLEASALSKHHSLGLVFSDFYLLEQAKTIDTLRSCSLIYIPSLALPTTLSHTQKLGLESFYLIEDYAHQLACRAQDLHLWRVIICKQKYLVAGAANANDVDYETLKIEPEDKTHLSTINQNNEYASVAAAMTASNVLSYLSGNEFYLYKHYLAQGFIEHNGATELDSLKNRGLLLKRQPLPYELLDAWYEF